MVPNSRKDESLEINSMKYVFVSVLLCLYATTALAFEPILGGSGSGGFVLNNFAKEIWMDPYGMSAERDAPALPEVGADPAFGPPVSGHAGLSTGGRAGRRLAAGQRRERRQRCAFRRLPLQR